MESWPHSIERWLGPRGRRGYPSSADPGWRASLDGDPLAGADLARATDDQPRGDGAVLAGPGVAIDACEEQLGWQTPAERWDGTPFTDRGFEHVPALEHLQGWLTELMAA